MASDTQDAPLPVPLGEPELAMLISHPSSTTNSGLQFAGNTTDPGLGPSLYTVTNAASSSFTIQVEDLDDAEPPIENSVSIYCHQCRKEITCGVTYKCKVCKDIDFCEECQKEYVEHSVHKTTPIPYRNLTHEYYQRLEKEASGLNFDVLSREKDLPAEEALILGIQAWECYARNNIRKYQILMDGAYQTQAVNFFKRTVLENHPIANTYLGWAYLCGLGNLTKSVDNALSHFKIAAKPNASFTSPSAFVKSCVAESSIIIDYINGEKVQDKTGLLRTTIDILIYPEDGGAMKKSLVADLNIQQHAENDDSWAWIVLGMITDDVDEMIFKYEKSLSLGNMNAAVLLGQITAINGRKADADPAKSYGYYTQGLQGDLTDEFLLEAVNGVADYMKYSNDPRMFQEAIALINTHKHRLKNMLDKKLLEERQIYFQNALKLLSERSSDSHPDSMSLEDRLYQISRDHTLRQIPGPEPLVGTRHSGHKTEIEAVRITADGKFAVSMSWTPLDAVKSSDGKLEISTGWTLPHEMKRKSKSYATLYFWKIDCENREIIPLTKDPIIVKDSIPLYEVWNKRRNDIDLSISADGMMASICSIAEEGMEHDLDGNSNTAANVSQANAPQSSVSRPNTFAANGSSVPPATASSRLKRSKQVYICGVHEKNLPKKEFIGMSRLCVVVLLYINYHFPIKLVAQLHPRSSGIGFFIAGKELFAHITDKERICRLYDTRTWQEVYIIRLQNDKASFSKGHLLPRITSHIWCFYETTSILVDLGSTNPTEMRFEPEFKDAAGLCVSPSGKWLAHFVSNEIFIYQIASGLKFLHTYDECDRNNDVVTVQFSSDESQMFVLSELDNMLKIYDLDVQQPISSDLKHSNYKVPSLSKFGRQKNSEDFVISPTPLQQGNSLALTLLTEFERSTKFDQVDPKTIFWGLPHTGLQIGSLRINRSDWFIGVEYTPKDTSLPNVYIRSIIENLELWIDSSSRPAVHVPSQFACYAIDEGERYVLVGAQNFQLRGFNYSEPGSSRVEYVWAAPRLSGEVPKQHDKESSRGNPTVPERKCIKSSMMYMGKAHEDDDEAAPKLYVIRIVFTDDTTELIPLPVYDSYGASSDLVAKHACEFLSYCADLCKHVVQKNNPEGMIHFYDELQSFFDKIICSYPKMFFNVNADKITFKNQNFPLETIIKLEMESLLDSAIAKLDDGTLEYVPDFYEDDDGQEKSAFMQIIFEHRKGTWMRSLLNYLDIKFRSDGKIGWFRTVIPNLLEISELFPQEYTRFMQNISYIDVQNGNYFLKGECPIQRGKEMTEHPEFLGYGGYINSLAKGSDPKKVSSKKQNPRSPQRWLFGVEAAKMKHRPKNSKSYRLVSLYPVPLPNFGSYPKSETKGLRKYWHYLIPLRSIFADLALRGSPDVFGEPVMEAIIQYKWRNFAQTRYWAIQVLYVIYAIAFFTLTGLTQANDNSFGFQSDLSTRAGLGFCALLTILIGWLFIAQEIRQMAELCRRGQWLDYPSSVYNWLDCCAFTLPIAYSVLVFTAVLKDTPNAVAPNWLAPYGLLFMYFRFIMLLRVQEVFGTFVATFINSFVFVSSFLGLLVVIVVGFAHGLFLLLRSESVAPSIYSGPFLQASTNTTVGNINIIQDNTNYFTQFPAALRSVYFFLGGDFSPLENFSDISLDLMKVIFYASTSIFMFNILIALLSNAVNVTSGEGKKSWLYQMANVISETEMFWMLEFERQNAVYFPSVIFYEGTNDISQEYKSKIKDAREDPLESIRGKIDEMSVMLHKLTDEPTFSMVL